MYKVSFAVFVIISLFSIQTYSLSVIDDVTVSSDILQEIFLNELRFNFNLSDIIGADLVNARKCILQLRAIANDFPSLKTSRFIDSWGKFPSGLLYGHLKDYGNYDQCIRTSVTLDNSTGITKGQYCFATISASSSNQPFTDNDLSILRETPLDSRALPGFASIKLGVCVPNTCDSQLVTKIFQNAASNVLGGVLSGVTVSQCQVAEKDPFGTADIIAIVIFSVVGSLMVICTIYDAYIAYFNKKPTPLFLSFSVITNGKKLFMINTKTSPNTIDCLTGIRVFSMAWVLHCHNYMLSMNLNMTNLVDLLSWYKKASTMPVLMGTVSVDSFFFLSGLLVAWLGLRELDKTKGRLNVIMMWVHRYIRLTPALAALILFLVTLNKYIGNGPIRESFNNVHQSCENNWWATLLYVQNYVKPQGTCVMQSWYLAIDTQLYFLSPLVLIPLWKWGKKFVPVVVTLGLLSMGCIIATFIVEGYTSLIGFSEMDRMERVYTPTHTRYGVWLVGFILGYFMHINKDKQIKPHMAIQLIGWIVCFGTILSIIFGPYFKISEGVTASVGEAAVYESFKRVTWGIALAWIVFACHFGFGGLVNSFLSHPFWQPLGRLTYCLYLVHIAVQSINFGIIRTDVFFSDYTQILFFWSNFGISLMAAILLSLAFEAPILVIEKVIFGNGKPKPKKQEKELPPPSAPIELSNEQLEAVDLPIESSAPIDLPTTKLSTKEA